MKIILLVSLPTYNDFQLVVKSNYRHKYIEPFQRYAYSRSLKNIYGQYSGHIQGHHILRRGMISGIETRGSGSSMNRGPELLGAPESGAQKFYARKEYATSEKLGAGRGN